MPPDALPGATAAAPKNSAAKNSAGAKVQTFRSPTALVVWVVWLVFAVANWVDLAVQGRDHVSAVAAAILLLATGIAYVAAQRPRIIADEAGITVRNPLRDYRIGWASVTKVDLVDLLRVHCDWGQPGASPDGKKHAKVISSWAVHYSRRRQVTAESKARRASRPRRSSFGLGTSGLGTSGLGTSGLGSGGLGSGGLGSGGLRSGSLAGGGMLGGGPVTAPAPVSAAEAEAEKIARLLNERATAAQAETVWATGTAETPAKEPANPGWLEPLKSTWSRKALAALLIPALILLIVCLALCRKHAASFQQDRVPWPGFACPRLPHRIISLTCSFS
jgi:hypothetical protein